MAFSRCREDSTEIVDDAASLRDLTGSVRDRGYTEGVLEPVADQIDAALQLLDDRAGQLEDQPPGTAVLPPARAARHRLVVAAMRYLSRRERGPRGDEPVVDAGDIDDLLVVREVLDSTESDLLPYLAAEATGPEETITSPRAKGRACPASVEKAGRAARRGG